MKAVRTECILLCYTDDISFAVLQLAFDYARAIQASKSIKAYFDLQKSYAATNCEHKIFLEVE